MVGACEVVQPPLAPHPIQQQRLPLAVQQSTAIKQALVLGHRQPVRWGQRGTACDWYAPNVLPLLPIQARIRVPHTGPRVALLNEGADAHSDLRNHPSPPQLLESAPRRRGHGTQRGVCCSGGVR